MQTQPIDFNRPSEEAPTYLLPIKASVFAERAERFTALAEGHSLADWLIFLGHLTREQSAALLDLPPLALPDAATMVQAQTHGMPPLNAASLARPAIWRDVLRQFAPALREHAPEAALRSLDALAVAPDDSLEKLAASLLCGEPLAKDAAELPFVAAALQVVWTALASQLDAATLSKLDSPGVCPCCGSLPVASAVRLAPGVNNLRYLHCSLCNTQWNVTRATCTACDTDQGVAYQQIDGATGAVRAETCDSCKSYLKIVYQEKEPRVDPVADDLATLALDMLVDEAGYSRSGPNLLLIGGAGQ
jgi:FdhE protein